MKSPQVYLVCDFFLKAAGILTAVAVAIATLGIPLPVQVIKDLSQAFPCMDCGCGCVNAEMCWRKCCCYSNSQKLAWANKHGIRVPDFVLEQAAAEVDLEPVELADVKPCCRQRILAVKGVMAAKGVSATKASSACARNSGRCDEEPNTEPPLIPGVLAIHALKCQGLTLTVSMLPPSVPTDEIGADLLLVPGEQVAFAASPLYQPPFFDADAPPPEFAVL